MLETLHTRHNDGINHFILNGKLKDKSNTKETSPENFKSASYTKYQQFR